MKLLIFILTFFLVFILGIIYWEISKPLNEDSLNFSNENNISFSMSNDIFKFSKKYLLPARVLYEEINFHEVKFVILYKVSVMSDDKFALFNILRLLKKENITYSMIKQKDSNIYIVFNSLKKAEKIVNLFKFYNFPVKLQKIIKRI
jgi:hypothetical protein